MGSKKAVKRDIIKQLYPCTGKQRILVVQNIEDEHIGQEVKGLYLYVGRLVGVLSGNCTFIVNKTIERSMNELSDYLVSVGVLQKGNQPEILGIDMKNEQLHFKALQKAASKAQPGDRLLEVLKYTRYILPFIHSKSVDDFVNNLRDIKLVPQLEHHFQSEGIENLNNKLKTTDYISQKGDKMAPRFFQGAHTPEEAVKAYKNLKKEYKVPRLVCKIARSASAGGVQVVKSAKELEKFFDDFEGNNPSTYNELYDSGILIEECVGVIGSPGIILFRAHHFEGDKDYRIITLSDQLYKKDGMTHKGNIWPIAEDKWTDEIWASTEAYLDAARNLDVTGFIGLDMLITTRDGKKIAIVSDPNVRITGSTHVGLVIYNLYGNMMPNDIAWMSDNNFEIPKGMSLKKFNAFVKKHNAEFSLEKGGLLVMNHAPNKVGKTQVLVISKVDPQLSATKKQKIVTEFHDNLQKEMLSYINN